MSNNVGTTIAMGEIPTFQPDSPVFCSQSSWMAMDQLRHEQPTMGTKQKQQPKRTVTFPFGKCRICYDIATGVHYGVVTCEGCKGFFKRSLSQGLPYRCFFGDNCVINVKTRNRCKACRFKRCTEQGMAMESVKMGRIPKKVKEKALRNMHRYHERLAPSEQPIEVMDDDRLSCLGEFDDSDIDNGSVSSLNRESTSSSSSVSPSGTSSMTRYQSTDSSREIVLISPELLNGSEEPFRTVDLIELTISSTFLHVDHLNDNLSTLKLPTVFYESDSPPKTFPDILKGPQQPLSEISNADTSSTATSKPQHLMTVSTYISKINENTLVDYMFNYELRYSKNVLQIMKYLAAKLYQPFLIYELDFEVTSFFRYLRWKTLNAYLKHTKRLRMLVERMFGIIELGITEYPGSRTTTKQMWADIQAGIPTSVTSLLGYARDTLGFNELNVNDFTRILNHRIFDFYIIYHYPLFYKNESYIMTINGLHYTRHFMNQFIGQKTTDALHDFAQRLHSLHITQVEHSLIIPIVLCLPDEQLNDAESVHIIKYCYMYALYIQLCTTRTEDEAKLVFDQILQIVNSITVINQLCKENIGQLVLDNAKSSE